MALKDWKKTSNFSYVVRYVNKKTEENLVIQKDNIGWNVHSWKLGKRMFNTESQALSFAKKYMRSH